MEQTLCQIPQCFVYQVPPLTTAAGYRAAEWNASEPLWQGRLRVLSVGDDCLIKLEEEDSGELFATCPVTETSVEPVTDSSRYFVLKIVNAGKHAFIGIGFADRSEAFDFNVALQDHRKQVRHAKEREEALKKLGDQPEEDYSLSGPIKVNIKVGKSGKKGKKDKKKKSAIVADDDDDDDGGFGFLPPPPKSKGVVKAAKAAPASSDWVAFT